MNSIALAVAALQPRIPPPPPEVVALRTKLVAAFDDCEWCGSIVTEPSDEELAAWLRGEPGACERWAFHMDEAWRVSRTDSA